MKATAMHKISRREALKLGCASIMSAGMAASGPSKTRAEASNPFADYDALGLAELVRQRRALHAMSRRMAEFQRDCDVLLMPTLGEKPVALGQLALTRRDVQGFYADLAKFNPFCLIANQTGQPAMSVPLHWTDDEKPLPIGVQFFGRFGDEATLFRLARQLEKEQPWAHRRPTL